MGLYLTVVVVVVALFVNVGTLSTGVLAQLTPNPHHLTHSIVSGTDIIEQRSLRVNERDEGRSDSEERAGTLISKVSNYFKNNNVIRWADKHKSDDFVKGKLKLNGLSGDALTGHKNYKFFEKFVFLKEWNRLTAWEKAGASTLAVWTELGLGYIKTWDDLMNAVDTDAYKLYQRYADSFENNAFIKLDMKGKPMPVLSSDTSWAERTARMVNWKVYDKPEVVVMGSLGIDRNAQETLKANGNGNAFLIYWLLKNDNSINHGEENTKDILKKVKELDNLSPAELELLKNKRSLDDARESTKNLLTTLLDFDSLPPVQIETSDQYKTYKYLSGLIKKPDDQKVDEKLSTLIQRYELAPRLRK